MLLAINSFFFELCNQSNVRELEFLIDQREFFHNLQLATRQATEKPQNSEEEIMKLYT